MAHPRNEEDPRLEGTLNTINVYAYKQEPLPITGTTNYTEDSKLFYDTVRNSKTNYPGYYNYTYNNNEGIKIPFEFLPTSSNIDSEKLLYNLKKDLTFNNNLDSYKNKFILGGIDINSLFEIMTDSTKNFNIRPEYIPGLTNALAKSWLRLNSGLGFNTHKKWASYKPSDKFSRLYNYNVKDKIFTRDGELIEFRPVLLNDLAIKRINNSLVAPENVNSLRYKQELNNLISAFMEGNATDLDVRDFYYLWLNELTDNETWNKKHSIDGRGGGLTNLVITQIANANINSWIRKYAYKKKNGGILTFKNIINKFQLGGTMDQQEQLIQIIKAFIAELTGAKSEEEVELVMAQLQQEGKLEEVAKQAIQWAQQKQAQMARHGAKLQYLKTLKGICPQGQELKTFKIGGKICKKCVAKQQEGGQVSNDDSEKNNNFKRNKNISIMKESIKNSKVQKYLKNPNKYLEEMRKNNPNKYSEEMRKNNPNKYSEEMRKNKFKN